MRLPKIGASAGYRSQDYRVKKEGERHEAGSFLYGR